MEFGIDKKELTPTLGNSHLKFITSRCHHVYMGWARTDLLEVLPLVQISILSLSTDIFNSTNKYIRQEYQLTRKSCHHVLCAINASIDGDPLH